MKIIKQIKKRLFIPIVIISTLLLLFVGCSDNREKVDLACKNLGYDYIVGNHGIFDVEIPDYYCYRAVDNHRLYVSIKDAKVNGENTYILTPRVIDNDVKN